ncbi:hypothetical protein WL76_18025 [Burkholderia ubonensis]|uniref:Uncharacterized protein n=1 Tax=Burkholderia ubonensis TaxID=101571 RepID=A0A108CEU7_9BURK|nr:hypothetical protein [Burkholderia ubonensis]KWE51366.1 hypothetical protein WL76_18025 [Burkholderia ubonensis]KWE71129.1 hypothetical protein WL77_10520 [Burkholderia ubonensis]KWE76736.1 hypothetical protein WL79_09700 [Burkholderia ubonensis]KWK73378.1 hypothetical protein WM16_16420 [Burkholderia ubonensis]
MQIEHVTEYRGFLIRPVVTSMEGGRYAAAAIVTDQMGEARTFGVDGDFAEADEAQDQATELAIAWIDRRNVVSDHYVRRA